MNQVDPKEIKADQSLNARGLGCPMPLLKAKKVLEGLKPGDILEIIGYFRICLRRIITSSTSRKRSKESVGWLRNWVSS